MSGSEQVLTIHPVATPREIAAVLAVVATLGGGDAAEPAAAVPARPAWATALRPTTGHRAENSGWRRSGRQFHV